MADTVERVVEEHADHRIIEVTQTIQPARYEVSGDAGGSWGGGYYDYGSPFPNTYVVKEPECDHEWVKEAGVVPGDWRSCWPEMVCKKCGERRGCTEAEGGVPPFE